MNMFRVRLFGLLAVLVFVLNAASATEVLAQTNDEATVRNVLRRSAESFAKNDLSEATKVWANDESCFDEERSM